LICEVYAGTEVPAYLRDEFVQQPLESGPYLFTRLLFRGPL
jgi:hypothetical protein